MMNSITASSKIRVREVIDSLSESERKQLKKMLPQDNIKIPQVETARYPNALLTAFHNAFPKGSEYSLLGLTAEAMLRLPVEEINLENLLSTATAFHKELSATNNKISKSKTTEPFLKLLKKTRKLIDIELDEPLQGETEITYNNFMGHPDARTSDQIFEIKLTGQLNKNWTDFLFQVFAYAAIDPAVKHIYLVLPLQKHLWYCCVDDWKDRCVYRDFFDNKAAALSNPYKSLQLHEIDPSSLLENLLMMMGSYSEAYTEICTTTKTKTQDITSKYNIGSHIKKYKKMSDTIGQIIGRTAPYQIFLGGPQSSKVSISDIELAEAAALVEEHRIQLYIHSPYIINLCQKVDDNWNIKLLKKNLNYANTIGAKGVVVHVGKSTTKTYKDAIKQMRENIEAVLDEATSECPLLLETPAGQGTETLCDYDEFMKFVASFDDDRICICIDTCHVYATGYDPEEYLSGSLKSTKYKHLVKLVHFNDSLGDCGSCVDRHAYVGTGHIGMKKMDAIAALCKENMIPMVIE